MNIEFILCLCALLFLATTYDVAVTASKTTRLYVDQFPPGSEHLQLPNILHFSIFMEKDTGHHYTHLPLLVESMRYNPKVQFVIINIAENPALGFGGKMTALAAQLGATNLKIVTENIAAFTDRVYRRLNIRVPFTYDWYYKLCDYKPTLAYLYPELLDEKEYKYWGYGDMDIIWGNFSRFAGLFQGQHQFIISGT